MICEHCMKEDEGELIFSFYDRIAAGYLCHRCGRITRCPGEISYSTSSSRS